MIELSDNGVALVAVSFVAAAVLGVLWGKNGGDQVKAIGDRVACGLFAMPLVALAVHKAQPDAPPEVVLAAPLPVGVYVLLLALFDRQPAPPMAQHFSRILVLLVMLIYGGMAAFYAGFQCR